MTNMIYLMAEVVLVGVAGAVVARAVLSAWLLVSPILACCRPFIIGWPGAVFSPGIILGLFIGGGAGRSEALHAEIGVALELMLIWGILRWFITRRYRRHLTYVGADRD